MKDSVTPTATVPPPADATVRAGALALALAQAATASGTRRSRLRAVLYDLSAALATSLAACYVVNAGAAQRMAAVAAGQVPSRKLATFAKSAAVRAAMAQHATLQASRPDLQAVEPQRSSPSADSIYVLPLETNPRWLGLVVTWPDEERAQEHYDVLAQVCPLLCLLVPQLVQPAPRRTRALKSSDVALRSTAPARKTNGAPDAYIA